jgi:hypothetical protein
LQVTALSDLNIPARYLSSESTKTETKAIIAGEEALSLAAASPAACVMIII